jgi:hypothetical protein
MLTWNYINLVVENQQENQRDDGKGIANIFIIRPVEIK